MVYIICYFVSFIYFVKRKKDPKTPNFDTLVASYTLLFKIVRHFQKLFQEKIRLSTTFKQHSYGHQVVNFDTSVASLYHFSGHQRHFGSLLGIEKGGKCDILVAFTSQCRADVRHLGSILWKAFSLKYDTLVTFRQTAKNRKYDTLVALVHNRGQKRCATFRQHFYFATYLFTLSRIIHDLCSHTIQHLTDRQKLLKLQLIKTEGQGRRVGKNRFYAG